MGEVSTIGLDIAKSVFQVHGVDDAGGVVIRKRVSRGKMLEFFADLPPCLVGIEACPSAHHWGRELQALGHTVKLMPPSYVKAYLKRSKNDANDAAAICEAVTRPSMRFVPIKTKEQQTALMLHRTRQLLVRQRTMLSNALRGHLAELGIVSAKGRNGTGELLRIIADAADNRLPAAVRGILDVLARQYNAIGTEIGSIDKSILALHRSCEASRRLAEIPGIGPIVATALVAEIGDWKAFSSGRSLAAWVGAQAAYERRQGQARQHHQAGQSIPAMVAGCGRHGRYPLRKVARDKEPTVARTINGAPTDQGGGRRTRQQDCTDGLGHHGARREIQRAEAVVGGMTDTNR
jgi:transposase